MQFNARFHNYATLEIQHEYQKKTPNKVYIVKWIKYESIHT